MRVRTLTPAREEFLEAAAFYSAETPRLGTEFIDDFEHALELIALNPGLGSPYEQNTRRKLLRRFPFQIIYEIHTDHLVVVAVAHQRQRPGYWSDRQR